MYAFPFPLACQPAAPSQSRFQLQLIATAAADSVDFGSPRLARSGPHGLIYVASQHISRLPMILDSTGTLLRTIGRLGEGPGEFPSVSILYPVAYSLVVGGPNGGASLFSPEGAFVRSLRTRLLSTGHVLRLRGDTMVVPEPAMSGTRFGLPLQLIAPTGDTVRSFGSEDRSFNPRLQTRLYRTIAPATDSTLWVARLDQYVIERWHMNGTLLQTITGDRSWFPPMERDWDGTGSRRYQTSIAKIHADDDGHLFVLIARARPDFESTGTTGNRESTEPVVLMDRLAYLEHVIEVLDARTGLLLDTIEHRGDYLLSFLDDGRVFAMAPGADGREMPRTYRIQHPTNQSVVARRIRSEPT